MENTARERKAEGGKWFQIPLPAFQLPSLRTSRIPSLLEVRGPAVALRALARQTAGKEQRVEDRRWGAKVRIRVAGLLRA